MVDIFIQNGNAIFNVLGWSRFWAFKRRIVVPLSSVRSVSLVDASAVHGWWKGLRVPGTYVPGIIVAGTYLDSGRRTFWDIRRHPRAIDVALAGASYDRLIVDVADPAAAVALLTSASGAVRAAT